MSNKECFPSELVSRGPPQLYCQVTVCLSIGGSSVCLSVCRVRRNGPELWCGDARPLPRASCALDQEVSSCIRHTRPKARRGSSPEASDEPDASALRTPSQPPAPSHSVLQTRTQLRVFRSPVVLTDPSSTPPQKQSSEGQRREPPFFFCSYFVHEGNPKK